MPDVVLPVLDEVEALPWVLDRMPPGYRPIVVDNGSSDGSALVAEEHGASVIGESRRGFGAACSSGLAAATATIVCFMDADGSMDPVDLPAVARPVLDDHADLVLGRRVPSPGAWPFHARAANRLLALEVRRRTGLRLRDLGPMRAARRQELLSLDLRDRRFGWPLEMVLCGHLAGWRIAEVPTPYLARSGQSKVTGTVKGTARAIADMSALLRAYQS